jgi:hypothetical protein
MRRSLLAALVGLACAAPAAAQELLRNGSFEKWAEGKPVGWRVDVGARNGQGPEALCVPLAEVGLSLSGDRTTKVWKSVSQQFAAAPTNAYRFTFEARVGGRRRELRQFRNCWVGFFFADADSRRLAVEVYDVRAKDWERGLLVAVPPPGTAAATVTVFLSQTGTLQVRNCAMSAVPQAAAATCYDLMVAAMERRYSFFAHKKIDWRALARAHRPKVLAADTPLAFVEAVKPLLAKLQDLHVTLTTPDGRTVPTWVVHPPLNIDIDHVFGRVHAQKRVGKHLLTGRTKEGFGYALVTGLPADMGHAVRMRELFEGLFDRKALIIDLRANSGGDERTAQQIIRGLVDRRHVYAQSAYRAGPAYTDLTSPQPRFIKPAAGGRRFYRPIVVLTGPYCVSSGEALALMLRTLPNVTLVGQPTRGASGNPKPVKLPNGVTVSFSTWVAMRPDGTAFEGTGIQPDTPVAHPKDADGDPTFEKAIAVLWQKIAEAAKKQAPKDG